MLKFSITLFLLFFIILKGNTQVTNMEIPDYEGEIMNYTLKVGLFQVGKVNISFQGDSSGCGTYVIADTKTAGIVSILKDIQYTFDACMDTGSGLAIRSSRIVREGDFTDYDKVFYDHKSREDSSVVVTEDNDTLVVPKNINDILIAFYQFRKNYIRKGMSYGEVIHIKTFFVDEVWDLNIRYVGIESVETKYGAIECYKFMPETEVGRYFRTTEDMAMWVTTGSRKVPIRFKVVLKVGTLTADLVYYKRPNK